MSKQTTEIEILKAVAKITDSLQCPRIQTRFLTEDTWLGVQEANQLLEDAEWAYDTTQYPEVGKRREWAFDREIVFKDMDGAVEYVKTEYE